MPERIVTKMLAGLEDLLFGRGTVTQARAGGSYEITKLSLVKVLTNASQLADEDYGKFPFVAVVENEQLSFYEYVNGTGYVLVEIQNPVARTKASIYLTATANTAIITIGEATKVVATTAASPANNNFTQSSGRLKYVGEPDQLVTISASVQVASTNVDELSFFIAINGEIQEESEHKIPATGTAIPRLAAWSYTASIVTADEIEVYVANNDSLADLTAISYNLTVSN